MKINFKKITSVLTSAVMLGSTVGFAAAANYPAPFITGGNADVAVVVGSAAATSDYWAALDIGTNLQYQLAGQTATPGAASKVYTSGEAYPIDSVSQKLNFGTALTSVKTTKITKDDLPALLAKKTYRSYDGQTYDYEQEISLSGGISYGHFADGDYKNNAPTLGFHVSTSNTPILNYTITFLTGAQSDVSATGRLEDLQNTKIWILGKEYNLLNAYNASTSTKLELMAGATVEAINLNEEKSVPMGDKTYVVKVIFVDSTTAKLEVNGEKTGSMTIGATWKLSDGTQVGIRDISYQNFAGGVMAAEVSIGAEKLTLENGQTVKFNDKTTGMNGVTSTISRSYSGSRVVINSITIGWSTDTEIFLTPEKKLSLPGFGSINLLMAAPTMKAAEVSKVTNDGSSTVQVKLPLKEGTTSIDILTSNSASVTTFTKLGKQGTGAETLVVSEIDQIAFDSDTDKYFVATYNTSTQAESYLLKASTSQSDSINYTEISVITDEGGTVAKCSDKAAASSCQVGNVQLTVNVIDYSGHRVNFTGGAGVSFNKVFTKEGLMMWLPRNGSTGNPTGLLGNNSVGAINFSASPNYYAIRFFEENKYGTLGAGDAFNVTVGGWTTDSKVQVSTIQGAFVGDNGATAGSANSYETESGTQKYVAYVQSVLGTKMTHDQSQTQDAAEIEYYGQEVYGNVFVAAEGATATGGGTTTSGGGSVANLGSVAVKDSEVNSVNTKNLIVIGGSCVNTVAQTLLGASTPLCGADFTAKTGIGADQWLIKVFKSPYMDSKVAMLVAGYEATDTAKAVKTLIADAPVTDVDTTIAKGTVTEADVTALI